jgi:hypothetical protein
MNPTIGQITPLLLASLMLVGVGCAAPVVSDTNPEEAALSLSFDLGDEFVLRPTVLGLGGELVNLLGGDASDRVVRVNEWVSGEVAELTWTITSQSETEESTALREAHRLEYAQTPIGEEIPDAPKAEYEETVRTGSVRSESMNDARTLTLPDKWPEGAAGIDKGSSLVWLSSEQYEELVRTRSTEMSLGLFDESLLRAEELSEKVSAFINKINSIVPEMMGDAVVVDEPSDEEESVTTINAQGDWGEYELSINGQRTKVRTIEAQNSFGAFTFLANPENPLLLEVILTPLAQGTLEAISPSGFVEGFGGYEVFEVTR